MTGIALTTHETEAEGAGLEAVVPEDHDAKPLATVVGEGTGAAEVFFATLFFFFVPFSIVGGGGGEGTTGEAGGVGSECSDEGVDPNRAPDEDDVESS